MFPVVFCIFVVALPSFKYVVFIRSICLCEIVFILAYIIFVKQNQLKRLNLFSSRILGLLFYIIVIPYFENILCSAAQGKRYAELV